MPRIKLKADLPDIQESKDGFIKKHIKKVGIMNTLVPLKVQRKDGSVNVSSATIDIYSDLNKETKGVNMSRYRIIIEEMLIDKELVLGDLVRELLNEVAKRLKASDAYVKIKFPYHTVKVAPASGVKSHMDYVCSLEGKLVNGKHEIFLTVTVPYTSCCPCSKEISDYGAHNQRSFADVTVQVDEKQGVFWIEDIIDIVESEASAPIINSLKREDEAFQTEKMYERPRFVEDMVRNISHRLDKELDKRIADYAVVTRHEESIHTHDAVAIITAGRGLQ